MNGDLLFGWICFQQLKSEIVPLSLHRLKSLLSFIQYALQNANAHSFALSLSPRIEASAMPYPEKRRITNVPFRIAIGRRLLFTDDALSQCLLPLTENIYLFPLRMDFYHSSEMVDSGHTFRANRRRRAREFFDTLQNLNNLPT